ncbi:alanine racemase [Candidatus Formimonas warabiya]|uniref:Alanine racemase n=1 Tax=Formimonas warabiya TaxID=1761012 RepID=A0A3G1KU16_FORW1|nr:alanine racemase [Candidatus Formimonas warabiya]ATW26003.1 alanine racemase [Candidatus Formimonas warabiya]
MHNFIRWIEVDLDAIINNFREIRKLVPAPVKILAVVKSDAYGHGAVEVAQVLAETGVDMFAVTTLEEGLELRQHDISTPILVFAPMLPFEVDIMVKSGLIATIDDMGALEALALGAKKQSIRASFHLKVETGMGRSGLLQEQLSAFLSRLKDLPAIEMSGVYSHLATAMMADKRFAHKQFAVFSQAVHEIRQAGFSVIAHIANSAAVLDLPEMYLDLVRVGTLLYGQYPSDQVARKITLKDPWQMKARVISLKQLKPGDSVGYGRDYVAKKALEVGIIPVGYADGFGMVPHTRPVKPYDLVKSAAKSISNMVGIVPAHFVTRGQERLPVIGRVGMQLSMIDVTGKGIHVGDEVVIPLRRTTSGARLPRIYVQDGSLKRLRSICRWEDYRI